MLHTRMTTLAFLLLEFISLCFVWNRFRVRSVTRIPSGIFWWYLVEQGRTGQDDMSHTRMTTLPFLLLALSPFVIFDSDYALISCPPCKSNTLWNILMILGRNVEQDKWTCRLQEWQLWLCYFWSYFPLLCPQLQRSWRDILLLGLFRPSFRPSIRPSVRSSHFLMHSITLELWMLLFWNFLYGFLMKK